ncbi:MAG: hypothetical protein CVV47_13860 [Spirochaetae bacterium HGW-Spirochaetae-3]|jgi:hypothetical protein|nr:MAG: hypothetical protein CVV47_13860 [Spirochaetae bacterium HGW-Spirochaetae-3]
MKDTAVRIALVSILVFAASGAVSALPRDASFQALGPDYIAEAVGKGDTEASAQNSALRAAIGVIMESLGKDRLFTELFMKNPPVTMDWKKVSSEKGLSSWTVRLRLVVDDESLRLLYNTAYVATVSTILDGSEARLSDAEGLSLSAREAETDGQLGRAMSLYWQARDACDSGLDLLSPIGDAAVFSTFGKKKAPELREVLVAVRGSASAGYDRIRAAERGLAADEELSSSLAVLDDIDADLTAVEAWADGVPDRLRGVEETPRAELTAFRDELEAKYRSLSDSRLALGRVEDAVPRSKEIVRARIDVVRRRIDGLSDYLKTTKVAVDREIRNPAIVRAKRAQNARWAFLHEPSGSLAFRFYTPFGLDPSSNDISLIGSDLFEFGLRSEHAFGDEKGVWIASSLSKEDSALAASTEDGGLAKSTGYSQSIDLGFYGRGMLGIGFSWDWLRRAGGENVEKRIELRALAGGVDRARRLASWLMVLSWEPPYGIDEFEAVNVFNFGLDGLLRLGSAVELSAGFELRPRESEAYYDSSIAYSAGAGFRLPKPFLWGIEFIGYSAESLLDSDVSDSGSCVRMFVEYSL